MYKFLSSIRTRSLAIVHRRLSAKSGRESCVRWFSLCGVLAPSLLLLLYIIASLLNPGFNHISKTVSQLGVNSRNFPWVIDSGFILFGVLMFLLASGLYLRFSRYFMAKLLWLSLILCGVGVLLVGVFHAEPDIVLGAWISEGMLHSTFAGMSILSLIVAMLAAADIFQHYPAWRRFVLSSVLLAAVTISLVLLYSTGVVDRWLGVIELLFYTLALIWTGAVALRSFWLPVSDRG
jgi:hypothetical membrane protein